MKTWTDIARATNAQILEWAEAQSWTRAMTTCNQDAQWHAEGDVWTHTKMVCAELERLADWPALDRTAQLKLLFTALFHDSGKPATTVLEPETGRTRSPKHSLVGAEIARRVLRNLECDLITREEIVALVRFHGRPPFLLEKPSPEHEVIWLSWFVNSRSEFARSFVLSVLGHSFPRQDHRHRPVAGISSMPCGKFVPIEGVTYFRAGLSQARMRLLIEELWPLICSAKTSMILLDGVWSLSPGRQAAILALARSRHVVLADQFKAGELANCGSLRIHHLLVSGAIGESLRVEVRHD